jgi:hypothetical protein
VSHSWDPLFASIADSVTPNWDAAAAFIEEFTVEQLRYLLQWDNVAAGVDSAAEHHLPAARDALHEALSEFRSAVENGHRQMVRFWTRDIFVYVVDDHSATDLWSSMPLLRWSGVLVAAGFDDTR